MRANWGYRRAGSGALALAAAAAVLALLAGRGRAQEAVQTAAAGRPTIAVVDMNRVLQASDQWRDMADERNRRMVNMTQALKNLTEKAQVLRNEFDAQPPGSPQRQAAAQELQVALQELQNTRIQFEQEADSLYGDALRTMFQQVSQVVADYAREHDIDLVLKKQTLEMDAADVPGQSLVLATTEVLYAREDLDISEAVIERLNAAYPGPIEVR